MAIGKKTNLIVLSFLIVFLSIHLFGKNLIQPFWNIIYTIDYIPLDLITQLKLGLATIISMIPQILCGLVLLVYSRDFYLNSFLWGTLGLILGPLVFILFFIYLIANSSEKIILKKSKTWFIKVICWILIILVAEPIINLSTKEFPSIFLNSLSETSRNQFILTVHIDEILRIVFLAIVNLSISIWIGKEAKEMKYKPWVWIVFGLVGGIYAPIFYYIYRIIRNRMNELQQPTMYKPHCG